MQTLSAHPVASAPIEGQPFGGSRVEPVIYRRFHFLTLVLNRELTRDAPDNYFATAEGIKELPNTVKIK